MIFSPSDKEIMDMIRRILVLSALVLATQQAAFAAQTNSQYSSLASDTVVGHTAVTLLQQTVTLTAPGWVYVESDGRAYPSGGKADADLWLTVDGAQQGNASVIDWSKTTDGQQHSYNAIAAVYLSAGQHTISLVGGSLNTYSFSVGASSNLNTMVSPATTVSVASLSADTGTLSFNTAGLTGTSVLPTSPLITLNVNGANGVPVVALTSSRNYQYGNPGDPLSTVTLDGATLANNEASWADNDLNPGAENQAPFFTNAYIPSLSSATHSLSLAASALPYSGATNTVQYRAGADSTIVALQGMQVAGEGAPSSTQYNVIPYICVGTSEGYAGCPTVNSNVVIAQGQIVIPPGHNGIALITGKTRIQADDADAGGTASLFLTIDGTRVGSLGVQQLKSPNSVSTRTLSTSFLTSGANALSVGTHQVVLYGAVSGSFIHACMTEDLPLIWFD
jgi:hypothetical protein